MNDMIIEIIITTFTLGGIIGAAAALSLRSSRFWQHKQRTVHHNSSAEADNRHFPE